MTFYQELQLNQAGSKNLLKKSETLKEKLPGRDVPMTETQMVSRSEERRVGKECLRLCRSRWSPYH